MESLSLKKTFELQEEAARSNVDQSAVALQRFNVIGEAFELITGALSSLPFTDEKQHMIRLLSCDAVSSLANSVRVGLSGNFPDSLALLRVSLETATVLWAMVRLGNYKTGVYELSKSFDRTSYECSLTILGDTGVRIKALHGRLSDLGSHGTSNRMKFAEYRLKGERYDRVGFALDPEAVEMALLFAMDVCLQIAYAIQEAHEQENRPFAFAEKLIQLLPKYMDAQPRAQANAAS